jgi:hypothetical protein
VASFSNTNPRIYPSTEHYAYTVGYLFYIVHAVWNPDKLSGYTHKFNLRGNNFLTRIVKKIWKFLNVCV